MASIQQRKSPEGSISYRVQVRLRGFPPVSATFERRTDAKQWAKETEVKIKERRYFKSVESEKHTLADLVDRYINDVVPEKGRTGQDYARHLTWWKEQIGHHLLCDVTPSLLAEHRDKLRRNSTHQGPQRSGPTCNRYLAALSSAFSLAQKEWEWLSDNPVRKVGRFREHQGRDRFLSDGERQRLLLACANSSSQYLYPIVILALATGMRKGEITGLRWKDVDLQRGLIILHKTKNRQKRNVPLLGHAHEVISDLAKVRHLHTNLLFPGKPDKTGETKPIDPRSAFERAMKEAGIEDFVFHGLRHCAASALAMGGASEREIMEVLGHKSTSMAQRYSHLSETHTRGVVARMNEQLFSPHAETDDAESAN